MITNTLARLPLAYQECDGERVMVEAHYRISRHGDTSEFDPTNRPASLTNNKPLLIGRHAVDPTVVFRGLIDEVEIFNRALDRQEIRDVFNAGSAGKCKLPQGQICIVKFYDLNHDGIRDNGEPPLSGWTFNVTDQNNNLVGAILTNHQGADIPPACRLVPAPFTYTVTEQVLPFWISTTPNPRTVTVLPGQTVNLSFGNRPVPRRRAVGH
jgi:hypothetical protein